MTPTLDPEDSAGPAVSKQEEPVSEELEALSWGWTIIANAGGGDWTRETPEWQEAAAKWRDRYHELLHSALPPEAGNSS